MFIEKLSVQEKENLKNLCSEYKNAQTLESDSKKAKEAAGKAIKALLDKYNVNDDDYISEYHIIYKEQEKKAIDSDKLKAAGLYDTFSKIQVSKPLNIK